MFVLFSTTDPAHPNKPPVERLINPRHIVDVEPIYSGESQQPAGSLIRMIDKRLLRVDASPREVQRAYQTGAR